MFYENQCQSFFFNKVAGLRPWNFIKKKTLAQVFSCEFCEISKNTFFTEHLWTTDSEFLSFMDEGSRFSYLFKRQPHKNGQSRLK